jgi:hypothetical protein
MGMFKEITTSPLNKTIVLRLELRGRTNLLTIKFIKQ